jgi:hypothetical protein
MRGREIDYEGTTASTAVLSPIYMLFVGPDHLLGRAGVGCSCRLARGGRNWQTGSWRLAIPLVLTTELPDLAQSKDNEQRGRRPKGGGERGGFLFSCF